MDTKTQIIILLVILIIVIIGIYIYKNRNSFFSKKTSESESGTDRQENNYDDQGSGDYEEEETSYDQGSGDYEEEETSYEENFFEDSFLPIINYEEETVESESEEIPSILLNVSEQECADGEGTNYNQCPETGIIYCCGVCDGKALCPSDGSLQNCACIGELTKENSDLVGYALKYSDLYYSFKFNEEELWNHWVETGKDENRILHPKLPMDDRYNQEGFPAHPMPTLPNWQQLKNDDGTVIFNDGWIWHLPMPRKEELPTGLFVASDDDKHLYSVPIDVCKFYRDYNNEYTIDHPVKLYVNVDDKAHILHNNKYIMDINGQGNPGIDLVLTPGKNRIMIICYNGGGPAGLQAAMMDDVNDFPLISTAVQSSWKYINDIYYHGGGNLESHGDWSGCAKLKVPDNNEDMDGRHTFWYHYNNTSGTVVDARIESRCDDYMVLWHERKLIGAKAINDPESYHVRLRPGKNVFCISISNYGGPGWIALKCQKNDGNDTLFKTETSKRWGYKKTMWYPGPAELFTAYPHGNFNNNGSREGNIVQYRYGVWNRDRMVERGIANDQMGSAKVPRGMQVTLYKNNDMPNGWNQTLTAATDYDQLKHFNDIVTAFVIQTPQYNRALFFAHSERRNQKRFANNYLTNNAGLTVGEYDYTDMEDKGIDEDDISDVIWPKGMKVQLYERRGQKGTKNTKDPNSNIQSAEAVPNINDKTSSIKVEVSGNWGYTKFQVFNDNLLGAGNIEKFLSQ